MQYARVGLLYVGKPMKYIISLKKPIVQSKLEAKIHVALRNPSMLFSYTSCNSRQCVFPRLMHRGGRGGPPPRRGYQGPRHYRGNNQGGGFRGGGFRGGPPRGGFRGFRGGQY